MRTTEVKSIPAMGFKKRHLFLIIGIIFIILMQSCEKSIYKTSDQANVNQRLTCMEGFTSIS